MEGSVNNLRLDWAPCRRRRRLSFGKVSLLGEELLSRRTAFIIVAEFVMSNQMSVSNARGRGTQGLFIELKVNEYWTKTF